MSRTPGATDQTPAGVFNSGTEPEITLDDDHQILVTLAKPGCLSRAWTAIAAKGDKYPKTRTFLVTLLVLGIIAAAASLGIHYGMTDGFAGLHHKLMELTYGVYIGMGVGAGGVLAISGITYGIHKLLNRKPADEIDASPLLPEEN